MRQLSGQGAIAPYPSGATYAKTASSDGNIDVREGDFGRRVCIVLQGEWRGSLFTLTARFFK